MLELKTKVRVNENYEYKNVVGRTGIVVENDDNPRHLRCARVRLEGPERYAPWFKDSELDIIS
jgi:hypothetical protein